jgi:predicted AAA+ superfamily ATPase
VDLDLIIRYNEWWRTGDVPGRLLGPAWQPRPALATIREHVQRRPTLVLSGLRRTGKSVLLFQTIRELLREGWAAERILYLSFDQPGASLEEALGHYERAILRRSLAEGGELVVVCDEVQKLSQWADRVKVYWDLYPNVKFVLSGSAALPLLRGAGDSLAGRAEFLTLHPCPFREFVAMRGTALPLPAAGSLPSIAPSQWSAIADEYAVSAADLSAAFEDYLWHGGFPEIATERDFDQVRRYVRTAVLARVVHQDLPAVFPIRRPDVLWQLLHQFTDRPGQLVRHDSLSSDLGVDRHTIAQYLTYLEQSCLLRLLWNHSGSPAATARKHRRAYPADVALTEGAGFPLTSRDRGLRLETTVGQHLRATRFWRESDDYEVDAVVPMEDGELLAVEVKNAARLDGRDLRGLRRFAAKHPQSRLLIVYNGPVAQASVEPAITAVPAWLFVAATAGVSHSWHEAG